MDYSILLSRPTYEETEMRIVVQHHCDGDGGGGQCPRSQGPDLTGGGSCERSSGPVKMGKTTK
jgi:hypothetical protein